MNQCFILFLIYENNQINLNEKPKFYNLNILKNQCFLALFQKIICLRLQFRFIKIMRKVYLIESNLFFIFGIIITFSLKLILEIINPFFAFQYFRIGAGQSLMLNKIVSFLEQQGYQENTALKQWQLNRVLDQILSRDNQQQIFDRDISKQIWQLTQKVEDNKVIIYEFLLTMEKQNKLKYLLPQSRIINKNEPSQTVKQQQKNRLQQQQNEQEPQTQQMQDEPEQSIKMQQYSQRESTQQRVNEQTNKQSVSNVLNATINQSVANESVIMNSSILKGSVSEIKIQRNQNSQMDQTPRPHRYVTPKEKHNQTSNFSSESSVPFSSSQKIQKKKDNLSTENLSSEQNLRTPLIQKSSLNDQIPQKRVIANQQSLITNESIVQQSLAQKKALMKKVSHEQQTQKISKKCMSKRWFIPICLFIFGIGVFLSSFLIHSILKQKAIDQVILAPENEGVWAHFPGDTKVQIDRNWTFFSIINPDQMLFYNQKPKFRQIQGFKIIELEDYLNITYIEDGDRVQMLDWLRFAQQPQSRNLQQKIEVLNVGGLGYWYNLKIARPTVLLQQGLALLFTTLQDSILENIFAQAIKVQFLTDNFASVYPGLFSPAGLTEDEALFLWNDTAYGLSDQNNLKYWIEAVSTNDQLLNQTVSSQYIFLKNYFTLENTQIDYILSQFSSYMEFISSAVLQNNYCQNVRSCTGRLLAYKQFANSYVTKNPPSGTPIQPTDSICESNTTCEGYYPQVQAYYEKIYLKRHPDRNVSLKFDPQWMKNLVNYNLSIEEGKDYNTAENCLFHIGNLDALWDNGTLYDKEKAFYAQQNVNFEEIQNKYLQNIKKRFGLETTDQAHVFWEWAKYITYELILRNQTNQKLGVGNLFSQGVYEGFSYLQDNLHTSLLIDLMEYDIQNQNLYGDCSTFVNTSFQLKDIKVARKICDEHGQKITRKLLSQLFNACNQPYGNQWKYFRQGSNLTLINLQSLCDQEADASTFGKLLHSRRVYLNDRYNCSITPKQYCSDYELAAIQWSSSKVTLNPPPQLKLQKGHTYKSWDNKAERFQYGFFASKYQNQDFPEITTRDAYKLLNFDNWFSASVSLKQFVSEDVQQQFKRYMRYVAIEVGLDGLTMYRSAKQMMFGYKDPILEQVKNAYPPFGGDPSTPSLVAFNDPNITKEEATMTLQWSTGKKNPSLLGQYRKINGFQYLTIQKQSFNGNITNSQFLSPWQGQDYMYGTSAKLFAPNQLQQGNVSLYVPNIQRYGSGKLQGDVSQRFGLDVHYGYLGESIYQSTSDSDLNKKYYQSFYAIFNETSVVGIPLFVSKNHFMNATSNWSKLVEIYNENQTIIYGQASHWDDSFVLVEPYTGVSLQSTIYLQSNYFHQPDSLLNFYQESMMPIFSLCRSGNLTESVANDLFGPLKMGLAAIKWAKIIGIVIIVLSCGSCGIIYFLKKRADTRKKSKEQDNRPVVGGASNSNKQSQLGMSLQPMTSQQRQLTRQSLSDREQQIRYIPPPVVEEEA